MGKKIVVRERVADPVVGLPEQFGVRGSPAWMAWVSRLAVACDVCRQELVACGLELLAERVGFEEPPPRVAMAPKNRLQWWARENLP